MRILVLGSGGREDAIAWALEWGSRAREDEVTVAPGNAGSSRRLALDILDPQAVVDACARMSTDLVIVGPETVLEAGVTDALRSAGVSVFGPSRDAARLETSKAWCRAFAARHGIPGPAWECFEGPTAAADARAWAARLGRPVVVKADGLRGGKGVVLPADEDELDAAIGAAAPGPFLLEERMEGEEVSLLVFTDGTAVRAMPPARDHKRIGEADTGPNTGGMGVYAPSRLCPPETSERIINEIVLPTVDGMRAEGTPYVGVLYAGVMLTAEGPRLVEFNCRFGDPEAQALLPLLRTDLRDVVTACVDGSLASLDVEWSGDTACTVVLAAGGYPASPRTGAAIHGLENAVATDGVRVFHAGTSNGGDACTVAGGRVLAVTGVAGDLHMARSRAYEAVSRVGFEGMQFRRDIGWREIARTTGGYAASGVDIDEGNRAVALMKKRVEATHTPDVLGGLGAFGGSILAGRLKEMDEPVLVASTDGVGTKVMLAAETGRYSSVGHDIVNHCVNDILVQRAFPMFFLDYVASSRISAAQVAEVVTGMADACAMNGCVLLGGETAEMPGVYSEGHFDVAGTMVGFAERSRLLPRGDIGVGDVLIGVASSGLHTNGYSLARRVFAGLPLDVVPDGLGTTLADALLAPHRSYLPVLRDVLATDMVKGLVHVTGGGFQENIPRVLPDGCAARVDRGSWPLPPLFALLASASGLDDCELHRTFNMGIGMIVVVAPDAAGAVRSMIDEPTWVIGEVFPAGGATAASRVVLV